MEEIGGTAKEITVHFIQKTESMFVFNKSSSNSTINFGMEASNKIKYLQNFRLEPSIWE